LSLTTCEYHVVDVFAERPFEGNPLAVFPRAARLDRTVMQRIAGELNLCETAFVVLPTRANCAAGLRIFTPVKEHGVRRSCAPSVAGTTSVAATTPTTVRRKGCAMPRPTKRTVIL
jgi:PhzF family phenazine biosynthesis protein